ncbi:MAG TPA: FkbM family methyltransferase [Candidatus Binatia bacterium]|nr:FkbM family methyltransferase [Candidatus Binatia bacterium]
MPRLLAEPRLTRLLVAAGVFPPGAFVLVDVGANGGVARHWDVLGPAARHVAFEPDARECARPNAACRDARVTYYPYALAGQSGPRTFWVRGFGAGCSFFPCTDRRALARFFPDEFVRTLADAERAVALDAVAFDEFAARERLPPPDFMKLDVEGAELEILEGASRALAGLLGACVEVHFDETLAPAAPFWAIDRFMQARGFRLFDLDVARYARRALPQPYCRDHRTPDGRPFPGPTVAGKPQLADALYLRDVVDDLRTGRRAYAAADVLKACCLYELHALPDYAAELLLEVAGAGGLDVEPLLDLLVPEVRGERLPHREHVRSLVERPERFRPGAGGA